MCEGAVKHFLGDLGQWSNYTWPYVAITDH